MTSSLAVSLVGAGAMGGALLKGWLHIGAIDTGRSAVFDPAANGAMKLLCAEHGLVLNPPIDTISADVMVVAVKPQKADEVLLQYAKLAKNAIVISVMAGKSIANISNALGGAPRVARTMPNLPAAIGKGITGIFAPKVIDDAGRAIIQSLMSAVGETVWVAAESQIDFVTAISGSGPAYYFLMTEALAEAGAALGLTKEAAAKLALLTLTGAGALMDIETRSPVEMCEAVTSPGGTTEAALSVLDGTDHQLRTLLKKAVAAAAKRASALTQ